MLRKITLILIVSSYPLLLLANSKDFRENNKYMFTISPFGLSYNSSSSSIEASWFVDADSVISAQFIDLAGASGYSEDDDDEDDRVRAAGNRGSAYTVSYKNFVSRTFYIKPQLYYKSQILIHDVDSDINGNVQSVDQGYIEDFGVTFKLGNQWQIKRFTLGCDWFGYSKTVATFKTEGRIKEANRTSYSFLNFYAGMTF